jgi:hypothetical protein
MPASVIGPPPTKVGIEIALVGLARREIQEVTNTCLGTIGIV